MKKLSLIVVTLFILFANSPVVVSQSLPPLNGGGADSDTTSVPEPSTLVLLGIGVAGLLARKLYVNRRK